MPKSQTPTEPFFVFALPRSRTAWLAKFLSYDDVSCAHEPSARFARPADISRFLMDHNGAADTMLALRVFDVVCAAPRAKIVVVRRPLLEVARSISRLLPGAEIDWGVMEACWDAITRIGCVPGVLCVDYVDLDRQDVCAQIFQHCLGIPMPVQWWYKWRDINVQADIAAAYREAQKNREGFAAFYGPPLLEYAKCRSESLQALWGSAAG